MILHTNVVLSVEVNKVLAKEVTKSSSLIGKSTQSMRLLLVPECKKSTNLIKHSNASRCSIPSKNLSYPANTDLKNPNCLLVLSKIHSNRYLVSSPSSFLLNFVSLVFDGNKYLQNRINITMVMWIA